MVNEVDGLVFNQTVLVKIIARIQQSIIKTMIFLYVMKNYMPSDSLA